MKLRVTLYDGSTRILDVTEANVIYKERRKNGPGTMQWEEDFSDDWIKMIERLDED